MFRATWYTSSSWAGGGEGSRKGIENFYALYTYASFPSFDFVKNCVHLKSLESNKRKHVDWYNELVNEENIFCRGSRSDTLDYSGKRILFTFLTGWFCACGSSSWIMKHANGNEAVLCQIIL